MAQVPAWASDTPAPEWAKGTTTPAWAAGAAPPAIEKPTASANPPAKSDMLGTTAAALDIPLSLPSMLLQTGAEVGSVAAGTLAAPFTGESPTHILKSAREHGQEAGGWLANPLQKALHGMGADSGYEGSAPAQVMQKAGSLAEQGATVLEKHTGIPKDAYLIMLDEIMSAGGARVPEWLKNRTAPKAEISAEDRLKATQPTGTKPPPDLTDAQLAEVEKGMPTPHPSEPIHRDRVEEMRKRTAEMQQNEPIAAHGEGDLSMMDTMYKPSPQVAQEIHHVLTEPDTSPSGGTDPMFDRAVDVSMRSGRSSISLVRRNLGVRWGDAEKIVQQMEAAGIIGPQDPMTGMHEFIGTEKMAPVEAARDIAHAQVTAAIKHDIEKQNQFELKGETESEIRLREALAKKMSEDQARKQVHDTNFVLTGSNREADIAAAHGQHDLLSTKPARKATTKQLGLVQTIKQMGGIKLDEMNDILGEKRTGKGVQGIPPGVFHKTGRGLDDLATVLRDAGYNIDTNSVDGGVQQLKDMIRAEVHGEKQLPGDVGFSEFERLHREHYEGGKIDPKLLARIAGVTGGAAAGAYLDPQNPLYGALIGSGLGFAVTNVGAKMQAMGAGKSIQTAIEVLKPSVDPLRKAAADAMFAKDANIEAGIRLAASVSHAAEKAIPAGRLERIGLLMSSGKLDTLNPTELYYAKRIQAELARIGSAGQEAGALPNLMKEYGIPLMWDMKDTGTKAFFDELMASGAGERMSASDFTPFSLKRSVPDYLTGIAGGLKPLTTNPAILLRIYAKSVIKATENSKALYYLKSMKTPEGYSVMPVDKNMPREYVTDHGIKGLEGFGVHPDMVESLKLGFDGYEPGMVGRGLLAAAFTAKRLIVSYSGFHATSELLAYTGAGGNPFGVLGGAAARGIEKLSGNKINIPYRSAVDKAFDAYYHGGAGDYLDFLLRNGLKKGVAIEDTVGLDQFRKGTHWIDTAIGLEKIAPFTKLDEGMHAFTFGYVQSGVKMATAMRLFEKELIDPKNAGKDVNQIAADVASFSNSMAGGLNFPRIIEGMRSKFGRALAGDLLSKKGLTRLQISMLAPDWFYSTIRAWTQAVPGLSENARIGRLSRAYLARSMIYTLIASDIANEHFSGHHIWENDFRTAAEKKANEYPNLLQRIHFMTQIDMGDGTRVNPNKHLYEFVHMMTDFPSFAMNKANPIVSEPLAAAMNKQWLTPKWAPPITPGGTASQQAGDYAKWLLTQNMPISLQQLDSGSNYGLLGFPSAGLTEEKRNLLREKAREVKADRGLR